MTPFTGTRSQFEALAKRGLILYETTYRFYIFYASSNYYYCPVSGFPSAPITGPVIEDSQILRGAWNIFDDPNNHLAIYRQPCILYKRG